MEAAGLIEARSRGRGVAAAVVVSLRGHGLVARADEIVGDLDRQSRYILGSDHGRLLQLVTRLRDALGSSPS